jgi:serine-type D-Ala-D-Ala carboxypeptidase (penicillin-binding protein 5/6)
MTFTLALVLIAGRLFAGPAETAHEPAREPLRLFARSAILIDQASGRVLYQRDADQPFVPASLVKLMSLHIVYQKLQDRTISRADVVSLSANAWANHQAPGSTLMNLGPGQIVTVGELMKGMAVASGNDAATALAEYVAGSTQRFVQLMNEESRFLGYTVTHFTDPSGVGEANRVTAREFADFCRRYIDANPEALSELHSLREFEYPQRQNMPGGHLVPRGTKKQYNSNYLVWDDLGVDGLKTGHLDNENFTAAITARRGDTRLIAVLLGVSGRSLTEGARNRIADGLALLSYGFRNFSTVTLDAPFVSPVKIWKGEERSLVISPSGPVCLTARPAEMDKLTCSVVLNAPIVAPVIHGQVIGELVYSAGTEEIGRIPLVASSDVSSAGLLRRAWDSVVLGFSTVVGGAAATLGTAFSAPPPVAIPAENAERPALARVR